MNNELDLLDVKQTIQDAIGWAQSKDINRLFEIMANDENFFIFHPDSGSTIKGFSAFRLMAEKTFMNDSFRATDYSIRELKIHFSRSGECAWWSAMLDDHYEWNGSPSGWDNCRWTGGLEKRDGRWVIIQMHFSFAKDD